MAAMFLRYTLDLMTKTEKTFLLIFISPIIAALCAAVYFAFTVHFIIGIIVFWLSAVLIAIIWVRESQAVNLEDQGSNFLQPPHH